MVEGIIWKPHFDHPPTRMLTDPHQLETPLVTYLLVQCKKTRIIYKILVQNFCEKKPDLEMALKNIKCRDVKWHELEDYDLLGCNAMLWEKSYSL